jgi:mannose-6-phosphate isomerase-like protein (cupin superfamily)
VIAGTARFTVGDSQREAPAGTFVSAPVGAEHTLPTPRRSRPIILSTFTPDLYVGYFRDLSKLAAAGDL